MNSIVWRVIASVMDVSNVRGGNLIKRSWLVVEDGRDVRYLLDDWIGVGPLFVLFSSLFRTTINKEAFVSDCFEGMSGCILWGYDF